jgi:hypothetical protein
MRDALISVVAMAVVLLGCLLTWGSYPHHGARIARCLGLVTLADKRRYRTGATDIA